MRGNKTGLAGQGPLHAVCRVERQPGGKLHTLRSGSAALPERKAAAGPAARRLPTKFAPAGSVSSKGVPACTSTVALAAS